MGIQVLKGVALALVVFLSSAAQAADKQVEDLLSHMRMAYQGVKSASVTTEAHLGANVFISTLSFVRPNKGRIDVKSPGIPGVFTRFTNGKTINSKPFGAKSYSEQPYKLDDFEKDLPLNLESLCFFDWDRQLSTAKGKNMEHSSFKIIPGQDWNGKKWTVLEETAKAQNVVCKYFIDPKTNLIWRTTAKPITGGTGNVDADFKITKMDLAAKIDESAFNIVHV